MKQKLLGTTFFYAPEGVATTPLENIDDAANSVLSLLDDDGAGGDGGAADGGTPPAGESEEAEAARIAAGLDDDSPQGDDAEGEPEAEGEPVKEAKAPPEPAIEPPVSWKAEEKVLFSKLPPETQKVIAARESEREAFLTKNRQETAEASRKAEETLTTEREALAKEQQATVERIQVAYKIARQAHPIIAAGDKLGAEGWAAKFAQDMVTATAERKQYEMAVDALNGNFQTQVEGAQKALTEAQATKAKAIEDRARDDFRANWKTLEDDVDLGPIWKDKEKRIGVQKEVKEYLTTIGYSEAEAGSVVDARQFIGARKAMLYDKLMAENAKVAALKKVKTPPKKPLQPGADEGAGDGDQTPQDKAVINRASKTTNLHDKAATLASLF